ncbi:MAG TPA: hypothetical protein PLX27_05920 [Methanolinea sp.]|nr:hypothetical protein [Methanolinea sp.]HQJ19048.1 hypothetical protein [Methanolinea sp.]HRS92684.1 hypothetical protein [Methanolinea sp.]
MHTSAWPVAIVILLVLVAIPANAMTSESLDISIRQDGKADIRFAYHLDWLEYIAVYLRLVDPAAELKKALESNFGKPVTVISVNSNSVHLSVDSFAQVSSSNGTMTARTPGLSFAAGEKILKSYWFAPLVTADLSPSVTTIRFPDGYVETFPDRIEIPPLVHTWKAGEGSQVPG